MAPNRLLKDRSVSGLFSDLVHGSECVAPGPGPSSVTMIDRQGFVWIADVDPGARGGYSMRPGGARAYLGPGRPLGFKYDAKGNLIICDSLKGLTMLEGGDGARLVVLANRCSPPVAMNHLLPDVTGNNMNPFPTLTGSAPQRRWILGVPLSMPTPLISHRQGSYISLIARTSPRR